MDGDGVSAALIEQAMRPAISRAHAKPIFPSIAACRGGVVSLLVCEHFGPGRAAFRLTKLCRLLSRPCSDAVNGTEPCGPVFGSEPE